MATVPRVTSGSGLRKFQIDGFLSDGVHVPMLQNFLSQIIIFISVYTRKVANNFQELKVLTGIWQKENSPLV
jgi:hypothetical protein